jgi:hypothetical protein
MEERENLNANRDHRRKEQGEQKEDATMKAAGKVASLAGHPLPFAQKNAVR